MRTQTKIALTLRFIVLLAVGLGLWWLTATNTGLQIVVKLLAKYSHATLTLGKIEGTLRGPIHLTALAWKHPTVQLQIEHATLKFSLKDLLLPNRPPSLSIMLRDITLATPTKTTSIPTSKVALRKLLAYRPYLAKLQTLSLDRLTLIQPNGNTKQLKYLTLKANTNTITPDLNLELTAPNTLIRFTSKLDQSCSVTWQVQGLDLSLLSAQASGQLVTQGQLLYKPHHSTISSTADLTRFKYQQFALQRLHVNLTAPDCSDRSEHKFQLQGTGLSYQELRLNRLSGTGKFKQRIDCSGSSFSSELLLEKPATVKTLIPHRITLQGTLNAQTELCAQLKIFITKNCPPAMLDLQLFNLKTAIGNKQYPNCRAHLTWATQRLDFISALFPALKNPTGNFTTDLNLSGTLAHPQLSGSAQLKNFSLALPALHTSLKGAQAQAHLKDNILTYTSQLPIGSRQLNLDGNLNLLQPWTTNHCTLSGTKLRLFTTQEYNFLTSLELQVHVSNHRSVITGDLTLEEGFIKPQALSTFRFLPPEIVYTHQPSPGLIPPLALQYQLNFHLGPRLYTEIFGLSGQVVGDVTLSSEPNQITTAQGTLMLQDATYSLNGQKLTVTYGLLNFFDCPLYNPQLELIAVKKLPYLTGRSNFNHQEQTVTVGAKISGPLNNFKTALFSEPAGWSSGEILSYLVTGQSLEEVSEGGGMLLLHAASALNLSGSNSNLLETVKHKLGLSELTVGEKSSQRKKDEITMTERLTEDDKTLNKIPNANKTFMLGKHLTPRLYVGYSLGLVNQISTFNIQYLLNKYLALRTEHSSDDNNAIDLIYTIER